MGGSGSSPSGPSRPVGDLADDDVGLMPDLDIGHLDHLEAGAREPVDALRVELLIDEAAVEPLALHLEDEGSVDGSEVDTTDPTILVTDVDLTPQLGSPAFFSSCATRASSPDAGGTWSTPRSASTWRMTRIPGRPRWASSSSIRCRVGPLTRRIDQAVSTMRAIRSTHHGSSAPRRRVPATSKSARAGTTVGTPSSATTW